jgi:membrane-associated phospholipid phosphatase
MMTKDFFRSPFFAFCLAMLLVLAYPILVISKGEIVMLINEHHHLSLDYFFKYITHLGDGTVMAIILIGLLFYSYKLSILTAFSIIFQSILVSIFKRLLYKGLERPTAFIDGFDWQFVDGVDVHGSNTFPSGHTTTAFALIALLVIVFKNRGYLLDLGFFLLAYFVGFSRIYLLQHFLVDIYFGTIFGILSVVFSLILMDYLFTKQKLDLLHSNSLRNTLFKKKTL